MKIDKKTAEIICYKADTEGLAYAIQNGYLDKLGKPVEVAARALNEIEAMIDDLKKIRY